MSTRSGKSYNNVAIDDDPSSSESESVGDVNIDSVYDDSISTEGDITDDDDPNDPDFDINEAEALDNCNLELEPDEFNSDSDIDIVSNNNSNNNNSNDNSNNSNNNSSKKSAEIKWDDSENPLVNFCYLLFCSRYFYVATCMNIGS